MNFLADLVDKVTIVTGGSQESGLALARGLAQYGCKIIIFNRKTPQGEAAAQSIREEGGSAIHVTGDVSQKKSVEGMVEKTLQQYGRIDILINNAGVNVRKPAVEVSAEDWETIFSTNLQGLFLCSQIVGRQMIQRKGGKIVNVSSMGSTFGLVNRAPYCASKAGVAQLTKTLALEWAQYNVYVNAIAPGIIQTPLTEAYMQSNPARLSITLHKLPLGYFGKPENLVGATLFLASAASDYITGQTLYIDGGYSLGCMDW